MARAQRQADFGIWHVPGLSPVIVYSKAAMHELAVEVFDGYQSFSPGGYEVGGVLFGTADGGEIRITASREITCEHEAGPEFTLSAGDKDQLERLLREYPRDAALAGLTPVGWYRSRSKGEITMTEADVEIWNDFFPQPWQVTLIVRAYDDEPVKGGFFFRPAHGPLRTTAPHQVFDVSQTAPGPVEEAPAEIQRRSGWDGNGYGPPPAELLNPQRGMDPWRPFWWGVAATLIVAGTVAGYMVWDVNRAKTSEPPAEPEFALRLTEEAGQLRASWDSKSEVIRLAQSATMLVRDGNATSSIPLEPGLLKVGYWPLPRVTPEVTVRLEVKSPLSFKPTVEMVQFVAARKTAPVPTAPNPENERARKQLERVQNEISQVNGWNERLAREEERLTKRLEQATARRATVAEAKPPVAPPPASAPAPISAPVAAAPSPAPVPAAPTTNAAARPAVTLPPAPEPRPRANVYTGPTTGRLIWTGVLPPGGTLTIVDGKRASVGAIAGSLPGVPVRVMANPAEFSAGGLSVYSAATRYARDPVTETRNAKNGWLNTKYVYDPSRAQDVSLAETPAGENSFQKIVLRGGSKSVTAIVIDWEVAQ